MNYASEKMAGWATNPSCDYALNNHWCFDGNWHQVIDPLTGQPINKRIENVTLVGTTSPSYPGTSNYQPSDVIQEDQERGM